MTTRTQLTWKRAPLLVLMALSCGPERDFYPPDDVSIRGTVTDEQGRALIDVEILDAAKGTKLGKTNSEGSFEVRAALSSVIDEQRALLKLEHSDHAPQMISVPRKAGVGGYTTGASMTRLKQMKVPEDGDSMSVPVTLANGREAMITIADTSSLKGGTLRVAPIKAENGPGELRDADAGKARLLQSGAMLYVDIVDAAGKAIQTPSDIQISLSPFELPSVTAAERIQTYRLKSDGRWEGSQTSQDDENQIAAKQFGYWSASRNFRTACVKGQIQTSQKLACKGSHVSATGPEGTAYRDASEADGTFCVMGAQGLSAQAHFGSMAMTLSMPARAGSCDIPSSCDDVGTIRVPDDACGEIEKPAPAPSSSGGGGSSGGGSTGSSGGVICSSMQRVGRCSLDFCTDQGATTCYYRVNAQRFSCGSCQNITPCAQSAANYLTSASCQ